MKHAITSVLFVMLLAYSSIIQSPSISSAAGSTPSTSSILAGVDYSSVNELLAHALMNAGIGWIRADVGYPDFPVTYSIAQKYNLSIIGILDYNTVNFNNSFTLDDWKNAVAEAQRSYPHVEVWEIWNEPTNKEFQLGYMDGTPQHYLDLLRSAYAILKTANPSYVVLGLGGAQLGNPKDYALAAAVLTSGGNAFMDAISIHAYPYSLNIGQDWPFYKQDWAAELSKYKQFGKPFWVTETGLQSTQMNESDQSAYLENSYRFFEEEGASAYVWYQLIDYQSNGKLIGWGLLRQDMSLKPSYVTYEELVKTASQQLLVRRRA
jgi:hypothetical protein